jgi:CXXC-20-CXXC protein
MPTCQNCHEKWSWKQTFKKSFTLDTALPCPFCGEKQYLTSRARKRGALLTMIIPFLIFIPFFFDITIFAAVSVYFAAGIGIMLIYPFVVELSNKEKAFW